MAGLRALFVGFDPETMDLAERPAGMAVQIQEGIDRSMAQMRQAGFDATFCPLDEGDSGAEQAMRAVLRTQRYDCVVIGAGIRLLPKHTVLFEALVSAVRELAPAAKLAFNSGPGDACEAVQRQVPS